MNEYERKLKEGYLAALRAGVESDVKASIYRYVGRLVEIGKVGADEALEAAAVATLATERAVTAVGGGDATAGAIGEAEGLAVAAVQAKAGELMRGLVVIVDA